MDKLIIKMADILEVKPNQVKPSTNFRTDFPDWDSLKGFATLVMLEEEFNLKITVNEFLKLNTITDLHDLITKLNV